MSIVPKETIEVIAQSIGVNNLSPDVLPSLAADVEYRVREIMQVINLMLNLGDYLEILFNHTVCTTFTSLHIIL